MSKALLYDSFQSGIRLASVPMPQISAPSHCLIRMLASPINPSDLNQIYGSYALLPESLPAVGGNEGVGVVEAVGKDVKSLKTGDLVIPNTSLLGTWRQWLVAEESALFQVSKDLPIEAAATLAVNPPTAYLLLTATQPHAFIQNGANSAVGRYLIQMSAQQKRRSFNLIRPREDFEALKAELEELGRGWATVLSSAAPVEELKATIKEEARIGFNCVGGEAGALLSKLLPKRAEIITYGGMSKRPLMLSASALIFKEQRFSGFWLTAWKQAQGSAGLSKVLRECEQMFLRGQLKVAPMQKVPIDAVKAEDFELGAPKKLITF